MKNENISPRHVRDVLKSKKIDVSPIEPFLTHENNFVRKAAIEILVEHGDRKKILPVLLDERDKGVLLFGMTQIIDKCPQFKDLPELTEFTKFLQWYDSAIQDKAVEMFYRLGRTDLLTGLLFDERQLERIKHYMEEEENGKNKP